MLNALWSKVGAISALCRLGWSTLQRTTVYWMPFEWFTLLPVNLETNRWQISQIVQAVTLSTLCRSGHRAYQWTTVLRMPSEPFASLSEVVWDDTLKSQPLTIVTVSRGQSWTDQRTVDSIKSEIGTDIQETGFFDTLKEKMSSFRLPVLACNIPIASVCRLHKKMVLAVQSIYRPVLTVSTVSLLSVWPVVLPKV